MGKARVPGKWKGKVKFDKSEASLEAEAAKKQKLAQEKQLKILQQRRAADELQERRRRRLEGQKEKNGMDTAKIIRLLAAGGVSVKLYFAKWNDAVEIIKLERAERVRDRIWRGSCVHDPTRKGKLGGCSCCNILKEPTFQLPFNVQGKGEQFSMTSWASQTGPTGTTQFNSVQPAMSMYSSRALQGATGSSAQLPPISEARSHGTMAHSSSSPQLGAGSHGSRSYARTLLPRSDAVPLIPGGSWEEATHWRTGNQCWYNSFTGQMSLTDPKKVREEVSHLAGIDLGRTHDVRSGIRFGQVSTVQSGTTDGKKNYASWSPVSRGPAETLSTGEIFTKVQTFADIGGGIDLRA